MGKTQAEQNQPSVQNIQKSNSTKVTIQQEATPSISQLDPDDIIAKISKKIIAQDKTIEDVVDTLFLNQELISLGDPDLLNSSKANIIYTPLYYLFSNIIIYL